LQDRDQDDRFLPQPRDLRGPKNHVITGSKVRIQGHRPKVEIFSEGSENNIRLSLLRDPAGRKTAHDGNFRNVRRE
jgi:hypothetical protein